jgi:hypothetical protein
MFRAKTVLVIGAGASVEVGLPIGSLLLTQIAEALDIRFEFGSRQVKGDHVIVDALRTILNEQGGVEKINQHLAAARQLVSSSEHALSIDNVIEALEDEKVERVGKLGIARKILEAEDKSAHFRAQYDSRDNLDVKNFSDSWYGNLAKLLTENVIKSEIAQIFSNLEIVNFNYDRCLEQFLPFAISAYYGIDLGQARELLTTLPIHRPYGSVGKLPWQPGDRPSVAFGNATSRSLADVVPEIRTFTETVDDGEELSAIRNAVATADRIVFLGFAFHRQNVELISVPAKDHCEMIATMFGIQPDNRQIIISELQKSFGYNSSMNWDFPSHKCAELFTAYWRRLSAKARG